MIWKMPNQVFEDVAAIQMGTWSLAGDGNPEDLIGKRVTANLFSVLGVTAALGRDFRADDDLPGSPHVTISELMDSGCGGLAVIRRIVGKEITLNFEKCTVVGVMNARCNFPTAKPNSGFPRDLQTEQLTNHGKSSIASGRQAQTRRAAQDCERRSRHHCGTVGKREFRSRTRK